MIITLTGNNLFGMKQRLDELTDKFVAKYGDLALERYDGEEAEAEAILEAINSLPFLAPRKMVVVRNASQNKPFSEQIEQIISSIPETTDLVIYDPLTDKRTAFYKFLRSKTQLEEYGDLDSRELAKWLVKEADFQGGSLEIGDARYLVERLGPNQQLLSNELQKLTIYNPEINRENIDMLTEPTPQSKIFDLLDAAFKDDKKRALELYEEQRAQKVEPPSILAMLAWQLELITLAKLAKGKNSAEIAKEAGVSPFPISKAATLAKNIADKKLKAMVNEAFEMDLKSKTKNLDLDEALKAYILSL